jgi:hypothetical protein
MRYHGKDLKKRRDVFFTARRRATGIGGLRQFGYGASTSRFSPAHVLCCKIGGSVMTRMVFSLLAVAVIGAPPVLAAGTTPPGPWLPVVKDAIREALKNPEYVTFKRIFFVNRKTDDGVYPVCGTVNFKQRQEEHAAHEPFFGLLTPPEAGKAGSFASIQLGETTDQANEIATTCKNYGVY